MMFFLNHYRLVAVLLFAIEGTASEMGTTMDDVEGLTRPDFVNAEARTAHWLATVIFLLILPSFFKCFSFANKINIALLLTGVSGIYALLEVFLLNFADNDGIENRTPQGSA